MPASHEWGIDRGMGKVDPKLFDREPPRPKDPVPQRSSAQREQDHIRKTTGKPQGMPYFTYLMPRARD